MAPAIVVFGVLLLLIFTLPGLRGIIDLLMTIIITSIVSCGLLVLSFAVIVWISPINADGAFGPPASWFIDHPWLTIGIAVPSFLIGRWFSRGDT